MFSLQGRHSLLAQENTRQHFSVTLGGRFKRQNHQQKAWKCKNVPLTRPQKETLVYGMRAERRRQSGAFSAGTRTLGDSEFSALRAHPQTTVKALRLLIWGLQINFREKANLQAHTP